MNADIKAPAVGDVVYIQSGYGAVGFSKAVVTKVTQGGQVVTRQGALDDPHPLVRRFDKNGTEVGGMNSKWYKSRLRLDAAEVEATITLRDRTLAAVRAIEQIVPLTRYSAATTKEALLEECQRLQGLLATARALADAI
jgi:hypothetical protein